MKEIRLYKFSPLRGQIAEDTIIRIDQKLPESNNETLKEAEEFFQKQAKILADALFNSLPQGIMEPLTIEFLKRRVSLYIGKME